MPSNRDRDAASAANRFGLGAKPGTNDGPGTIENLHDPRGTLVQQVRKPHVNAAAFAGLTTSADYLAAEIDYRLDRRARKQELKSANDVGNAAADTDRAKIAGGGFRKQFGAQLLAEATTRWNAALAAPIGFDERVVRFWSNHFAVSVDKRQALLYAAPMEREAIRPHAFGRFQDLLIAVESHPAMLRYLDNAVSIGPDSRVGERMAQLGNGQAKRKRGINENLAREIFELHTLGVNGGYTQADIIEFARTITGWSLRGPRDEREAGRFASSDSNNTTGFVFRENAHEPGTRTILGKHYAEGGMDQGRRVLSDLAMHPATAKHLSLKLARHFVSDQPPPKLLQKMAASYLASDGDLSTLYLTMLQSDEAWSSDARKFRTPDDFLIASLRALAVEEVPDVRIVAGLLGRLGRPDFMPRSPAGFSDTADAWIGPDAVWKRIQAAEQLAGRASRSLVPAQAARDALGPRLDASTAQAIARAESPQQQLSLLLASPDFQWRI